MASLIGSCTASPPVQAPRQEPPARLLVVDLDRIALRESAALELRASGGDAPDLDAFVARGWRERATIARRALDDAVGAFEGEGEALLLRVAADLAIEWPEDRVVVDVVTSSEPADAHALVPPFLAARGRCFARAKGEDDKMHSARIIDCVIAYAARGLAARSAIGVELARLLPAEDAARGWELLVIHATAVTVHAWESKHEPVLRRSAGAVEPGVLAWLADNWGSRARGESPGSFASRYAAALRDEQGHGRSDP